MNFFSRLLLLAFASLSFASCTEVVFDGPQPPHRWDKRKFPKSWVGTWAQDGDTLIIEPQRITVTEEEISVILDDNNHLRSISGYFVLSARTEEEGKFVVWLAQRNGDVLTVYQMDPKDENQLQIWGDVLGADISTTKNAKGKVSSYLLAPENNAAFRELIKRGGFGTGSSLLRVTP